MVSGQEQDRCRPAVTGRKPLQPEVAVAQQGALLVGADVARQHQHIGTGGGRRAVVRMHFQVQVGQQLDLHGLNRQGDGGTCAERRTASRSQRCALSDSCRPCQSAST